MQAYGNYLGRDVEIITWDYYGGDRIMLRVTEMTGCNPFVLEARDDPEGPPHTFETDTVWVDKDLVKNVQFVNLPDDLPIPADPREDEVLDGERLGDAAWYRQVNDLQQVGRGA